MYNYNPIAPDFKLRTYGVSVALITITRNSAVCAPEFEQRPHRPDPVTIIDRYLLAGKALHPYGRTNKYNKHHEPNNPKPLFINGGRPMSDYLIVLVNRAQARFFTIEPVEFPELESGPRLTACEELENPEVGDARDIFSDSKTGRGAAAPLGGKVHGYDDKRDQHMDELRRRFAAGVLDRIRTLAAAEHAGSVILAVSARMRRFLYPGIDTLAKQGCRIHKLSKNMINFPPQKIHAYLAGEGLVPGQSLGKKEP